MAKLNFIHHDLGNRKSGELVEITLSGNAANVRLLDSTNLRRFKNGDSHRFVGGLAKKSPVRFRIPRAGHWHVTVDMIGLAGRVKSSVRVLPAPLPTLRDTPLSSVPGLIHHSSTDLVDSAAAPVVKTYDVFISYATEDKAEVARPLAQALQAAGLTVWFDDNELGIGKSIRRTIDRGLANSRFGVVVLSKHFFAKNWPQYELDGLVTKGIGEAQVLLPIWHDISKAEIIAQSPSLADKVARSTAQYTVEEIAAEISQLVQEETFEDTSLR